MPYTVKVYQEPARDIPEIIIGELVIAFAGLEEGKKATLKGSSLRTATR